ncbi:MAG: hypothetical protein RR131_05345 [Anaerovorax sp.]
MKNNKKQNSKMCNNVSDGSESKKAGKKEVANKVTEGMNANNRAEQKSKSDMTNSDY